jgi:hypothetical protein
MAAQDDSAYQDNPYGMTDPTQQFQQLTQQNQNGGALGQIRQGALQAGYNPAQQHAQMVATRMQSILGNVGDVDGEDPIDTAIRKAQAVSRGMANVDPKIAGNADQQVLRLTEAKTQQGRLKAETSLENAQTLDANQKAAAQAADPMVWVQNGKDGMGLPTARLVGKPVAMFNEDGTTRNGWSNDMQDELGRNGGFKDGMQMMRQSQYTQMMEHMNEGRNMAQLMHSQQQLQLQMLSRQSPDAIAAQASQITDGLAPMPKPPQGRNPVLMQNYNDLIEAIKANGADPGQIDESSFPNNVKQLNAFNHGPQADLTKSLNVAVQHAKLLKDYFTAQQNHDTPALNWIENKWADMTGQPIPKTVDAMKDFVSDEWVKGIVGQRPALADRVGAQDKASRNASNAQFASVMDGWAGLGAGQLNGLKREMEGGLKKGTGDPWDQAKMDKLWYGTGPQGTGGKIAPETRAYMDAATENNVARVSAAENGGKVKVMGPDGKAGMIPAARLKDYQAQGYKVVQ